LIRGRGEEESADRKKGKHGIDVKSGTVLSLTRITKELTTWVVKGEGVCVNKHWVVVEVIHSNLDWDYKLAGRSFHSRTEREGGQSLHIAVKGGGGKESLLTKLVNAQQKRIGEKDMEKQQKNQNLSAIAESKGDGRTGDAKEYQGKGGECGGVRKIFYNATEP